MGISSLVPKLGTGSPFQHFGSTGPGGGEFLVIAPSLQSNPTAFVYDHSANANDPAGLTGGYVLALPGLLPQLGGDDGALLFNAAGAVTYPAASKILGTTDFTITGFVLVDSTGSVDLYDVPSASGSAGLHVTIGSNQATVTGTASIVANVGISDGRAHYYVVRRTSGIVELYVDGTLVGTDTNAAESVSGNPAATFTTTCSAATATVDELAWWQRALTDTEIETLVSAAAVLTESSGLLSGQWLTRHLSFLAFSDSNIDTGSSMIDTPDLSTPNAAAVIATVAAAEDGMGFIDASGALRFIGRNSTGLSTLTFGDGGGTEVPFVEPPDWSMDIDRVFNRVQVTKAGAPTVTVDDTDSQQLYGIRTLPWDAGLLETSQMTDAADWFLSRYKTPQLRVDTLHVKGHGGGGAYWPQILGLEVGDRVTVNHRPPGGTLLTAEVIVEHIEHQITADDWDTFLQLAPMPKVLIADDPVQGLVDSGFVAGWGTPWPLPLIADDPVQGRADYGYTAA